MNYNGEVITNYIGCFENFQEDWTSISDYLYSYKEFPQIIANNTRKHHTTYYKKRIKSIIHNRLALDTVFFVTNFAK